MKTVNKNDVVTITQSITDNNVYLIHGNLSKNEVMGLFESMDKDDLKSVYKACRNRIIESEGRLKRDCFAEATDLEELKKALGSSEHESNKNVFIEKVIKYKLIYSAFGQNIESPVMEILITLPIPYSILSCI